MNQLFDNVVTNPTVGAIGLALGGAAAGLWLAAAWWAYTDLGRRTTMELARLLGVAWILLSTPILLPLALGIYLLARPQLTVAERRAQRLFEALEPALGDGYCPMCAGAVDPAWNRCPACAAWLASTCDACGEWSALDLDTCPWCARDKLDRPLIGAIDAPPVLAGGIAATAIDPTGSSSGRRTEPLPHPATAVAARRTFAPAIGNRGARDLRRTREADRVAGSSRLGVGS